MGYLQFSTLYFNTKFILNYSLREVSYINRLDQLNLLPLDFRRQMHDSSLL